MIRSDGMAPEGGFPGSVNVALISLVTDLLSGE